MVFVVVVVLSLWTSPLKQSWHLKPLQGHRYLLQPKLCQSCPSPCFPLIFKKNGRVTVYPRLCKEAAVGPRWIQSLIKGLQGPHKVRIHIALVEYNWRTTLKNESSAAVVERNIPSLKKFKMWIWGFSGGLDVWACWLFCRLIFLFVFFFLVENCFASN